MIETIAIHRDAAAFPDSHHATVNIDDLPAFEALGWSKIDAGDAPVETVTLVDIPADWQKLHHKTRVALAKQLGWVDGTPTSEQADGWIADILTHRERAQPQEALGGLSIREAHDKLRGAGVEWGAEATVEDLASLLAGLPSE
jgi:hypothetical protein